MQDADCDFRSSAPRNWLVNSVSFDVPQSGVQLYINLLLMKMQDADHDPRSSDWQVLDLVSGLGMCQF